MTAKATKIAEQEDACAELRKLIKPGSTVYTVLRSRSSSGMSRVIDLMIAVREYETVYPLKSAETASYVGERDYAAKPTKRFKGLGIRSIGWTAAKATGNRFDSDKSGIVMGGCGMDMGFALVYELGANLWPKGTRKPHSRRNGEPDKSGGYAIKQSWL
jgi:hypothetical protein